MRMMIRLAVAGALAVAAPVAQAQTAASPLQVDRSLLPRAPEYVQPADRTKAKLFEAGAGAAIGIIVVDVLTGGLLLAPLGLPGFSGLFGGGAVAAPAAAAPAAAAAAAVPEVTYTIAQRLLAAVGTAAAALGGGYLAPQLVGSADPRLP